MDDPAKLDADDVTWGIVAWSSVDLCDLGCCAWDLAGNPSNGRSKRASKRQSMDEGSQNIDCYPGFAKTKTRVALKPSIRITCVQPKMC